eukprot:gene99-706_t
MAGEQYSQECTTSKGISSREMKRTPPKKPPRRVCNGCKCSKEDHEIKSDELNGNFKNLQLVDGDHQHGLTSQEEILLSKYAWVPPGLDFDLLESYMRCLPGDKVPHFDNKEGMRYRNKQLLLQFPVQDTKFEHFKHEPEKSKHAFEQFVKNRDADMATGHVERAFRVKECRSCHQDITVGSAYVMAFNLGSDAAWHPGCFTCTKCAELLMNLTFYQADGEIYCGRHYAENSKPRCGACDELILFGEYVRASDQNYHNAHFCCWICDAELSGKQHLVESNQPICINCYNRNCANTCHKCQEKISMDDKDILYDNHHWHDTCLICVDCKQTLSGRSFLVKDVGEFICADCHKNSDTRRCKNCEQCFEPGMKRLELNGVFWHEECFVCELCKEPISSKRFMRHQDLTVCVKCYEGTFVKKCIECQQPLTQGGISYNGEPYHKQCFACAKCHTSIANKAFSVKDDKNFCVDCYGDLFAKKCKACNEHILTGEYYTLDDDTWHKQCFKCTKCNAPLASTSFVQDGDEILLICESCV